MEILSLHGRGEEDGCRGYNKRDETKEGRITKQNNGATRHGRWMVGDRGRDRKREGDSEREWFWEERERENRRKDEDGKRKAEKKGLRKVGGRNSLSAKGGADKQELRELHREGKIECLPPLSLTLKLRAALDSGGMLKYTVLSFPPSSLSIARNTCTTWNTEIESKGDRVRGGREWMCVSACVFVCFEEKHRERTEKEEEKTLTQRELLAT